MTGSNQLVVIQNISKLIETCDEKWRIINNLQPYTDLVKGAYLLFSNSEEKIKEINQLVS